jgi:hypothetical protein
MSDAANDAPLPLFYRNPIPVDATRHKNLKLKERRSFAYARNATAVPVLAEEFPQLQAHYPIVFTPGDEPTAVALMGFRPNENLFVREDGDWEPLRPVPAYVRRYPFILMDMPGDERMLLCMEEDASVVAEDGETALFNGNEAGPGGKAALDFCGAFNQSAMATQEFCTALAKAGVLEERQAEMAGPDNQRLNLTGFRVVNEAKLNELPSKTWLDWRAKGWVGLVYTHLLSMGRLEVLTMLTAERLGAKLPK